MTITDVETSPDLGHARVWASVIGSEADVLAPVAAIADKLTRDPRLCDRVVARPHPLLVTVRKDPLEVVIAPAQVWDKGRDVLRPFASKFAEGDALLVLVGRPAEPDIAAAINRGLGAIVSAEAPIDELYVAIHHGFELLEAKARAESRGKWLNRYRYELGELIEILAAPAAFAPHAFQLGADADLALIDPNRVWTVTADELLHTHRWTPFAGREVRGRVVRTILRGTTVYHGAADPRVPVAPGFGRFVAAGVVLFVLLSGGGGDLGGPLDTLVVAIIVVCLSLLFVWLLWLAARLWQGPAAIAEPEVGSG